VGKSTLVRQFAESQGLVLHEVNLERHLTLVSLFETHNVKGILRELEFICGKGTINVPGSLLFLDEIQAVPVALATLRYLYEDCPELPVVAAGSLLEFALASHSFSMPVGRIEYLFMGPVSFEEFLGALKEDRLLALLREYEPDDLFPRSAHSKLLERQREYLLLGGMPEAVQRYLESEDLNEAFQVQTSVVETYRDDFSKYAREAELLRIHKVFDYVPLAAGDKFKYSNVDPHAQARDVRKAVDLLAKAGVITLVFHTDASGIPLRATQNERVFKAFFLDCGLMNRMCGVSRISSSEMTQAKFINEGRMAEQFIAQQLLYSGKADERPTLNYWLREARAGNAEVDFVIQLGSQIIPVEVKAGKSGTLKSLQQFVCQKSVPLGVRFDLNTPSFQHVSHTTKLRSKSVGTEFDLISLPLYLVEQLPRIVASRKGRARKRQ
jgi:predicted AAA+ superfamily ATPase